MTENQFLLNDRCQKIRQIYEEYDLENTAYLSFSGGKDSTLLSDYIDIYGRIIMKLKFRFIVK